MGHFARGGSAQNRMGDTAPDSLYAIDSIPIAAEILHPQFTMLSQLDDMTTLSLTVHRDAMGVAVYNWQKSE
jgi:hypothetical protein